MPTLPILTSKKTLLSVKRRFPAGHLPSERPDSLYHLAFDNSIQANIISIPGLKGKLISANRAACKLLGYSKRSLLTKNRADIFEINKDSFIKMMKERTREGYSMAAVTAIKKNGKHFPCEITSAFFLDENGVENSITTLVDLSQKLLDQKNIDLEKDKIVTGNIVRAKAKQRTIDTLKNKKVADNIVQADAKQLNIDIKKDKKVAQNIVVAQAKSDALIAENNEWIKYIERTSYDVMWDWDISSGEIYVGDSITEMFGYKVPDNRVHFKNFCLCLIPEEKDAVLDNLLSKLNSHAKNWSDTFMIKRKNGSVASTISRASIIRNGKGEAVRLIGAIQDVSKLTELEKKLEEQVALHEQDSEKFLMVAKLSFDVIWDWNMKTDDVFIGDGFEELFGYVIHDNKGNMTADWSNHIHPNYKLSVLRGLQDAIQSGSTQWEHAYRFIRADGSIAKVFNRASIIRHPDGKAFRMIGAMQDVSKQKVLEEKLQYEIAAKRKILSEYDNSFKFIFNSSTDIFYDSDLLHDSVLISEAYEKEFGYPITINMSPEKDWLSHIHPDDQEAVIKDYARMLASTDIEWKQDYRFVKADGSIANVMSKGIILRNPDGKAYRMIGYMHDMSKQMVLEEKLEQEIKLKERQIEDAANEAKENVRSDIGKELHDNVNQLLGVSKLYLDMAKRGGEYSEMYLSRSSEYTMSAIEEIRKLSKGLTTDTIKNLGLCEAIETVIRDTMEVSGLKITWAYESFIETSVNDKFKVNLFRILQEHLNNILKHAAATEVGIFLSQNNTSVMLRVLDNGVGFDTTRQRKGIGIANINTRAKSFNGTVAIVSQPGQGCILTVTFLVAQEVTV
jgi:two-component system sensor histidine kinase UhpB